VAKVAASGAALVYSGYIGGSGNDFGNGIAVDFSGNAYAVGYTSSGAGFPAVAGPDPTYNGGSYDAFVAKIKLDGTGLLYSSFIGGAGADAGTRIAVDGAGDAYVAGRTGSTSGFPYILGPDLGFKGGTYDAFVAKIETPAASANLAVTKTDGPTKATPGTHVTYTITVTNNGPDTVSSLFVDDPVPAQITGAVFTAPPGTNCNAVTGEWTGLSLAKATA
jgi:uncharacterized repeat protein (TIGR01451 family)